MHLHLCVFIVDVYAWAPDAVVVSRALLAPEEVAFLVFLVCARDSTSPCPLSTPTTSLPLATSVPMPSIRPRGWVSV
jgi:hypothetical protein